MNAVYGKVGTVASEETMLQLISAKCIPVLLYGTDVCPLNKSELNSLDFAVTRFLMKLFRSNSNDLIKECRQYFGFLLPSELIEKRKLTFIDKYKNSKNILCNVFCP